MNYKLEGTLKNNKTNFIVLLIVWLLVAILLAVPIAYSIHATVLEHGDFVIGLFIDKLMENAGNPFQTLAKIFTEGAILTYLKTLGFFTIFLLVMFVVALIKNKPKHEYDGIENGSSGWSENGEQYKIINKNKGIILAENNYLPVDKRGNVNVLVVGRIRFW
ncbi:MAG: hypothetical protein IJV31_07460 [Clostridia bacterium]|nr:hypothetical protein [Clostridia bacterium]